MERGSGWVLVLALSSALFALLGWSSGLDGAIERAVGGRVTDASSGKPIVGAQIVVVATGLGSATDSEGRFFISGIPEVEAPLGVTIRHPCFHAVRVDVVDRGDVALEVGLPFRPASPEAARVGYCRGYGPNK